MNVARPSRFYRPRPLSSLPTNGIIVPRGPTNGWEWLAWGKCMEMYSRVKLFPGLRIRCQRCRVNIERKFGEKFSTRNFLSPVSPVPSIFLGREIFPPPNHSTCQKNIRERKLLPESCAQDIKIATAGDTLVKRKCSIFTHVRKH